MLHNVESLLSKTNFSESIVSLEKLFHNQEFQTLLSLHNKIQELCCFNTLPPPVCTDAQVISLEVCFDRVLLLLHFNFVFHPSTFYFDLILKVEEYCTPSHKVISMVLAGF